MRRVRGAPMSSPRRWLLPACLALGLLLRLGFGWKHPSQPPGEALVNIDHYTELAVSLEQSGSLRLDGRPSACREPGYPVVLGVAFKIFGRSYPVVLGTNCVLALLALCGLYLVGMDLFGRPTALLATAVGACYPQFVFYASQPVRETTILAVSAWALWALLRALRSPGAAAFAWAGVGGALCGLTNVSLLPYGLVLAPAAVWLLNRSRGAAAWRWSGAYTAAFVLFYSVWPIRNYLAMGTFIPTTTLPFGNIWYNYLVVPQAVGGTPLETEILRQDPVCRAAAGLDAVSADRHYRKAAREWIRRHPGAYLRLVAWRFFWDQWRLWPRPQAAGDSYRLGRWVGLLTNGWIIPLGWLGMIAARCRPRRVLCVYLFVFALAFTHAQILTMLRYRTPIMPWLILFAVSVLVRAGSWVNESMEN